MKSDFFLNPIRLNLRQGHLQGLTLQLALILRKAADPLIAPRLRVEIQLEAVKAHRQLGNHAAAVALCETAIANIPPDCFDLLSDLKRVRALLHLDAGELSAGRSLIEGADGLEMVLQGGMSVITRQDEQVTVETWLVSWEIAMVQGDRKAAASFFDKAVSRLALEEAELRRRRATYFDKRRLEQYYHDIGRQLNLCGLTLSLADAGDSTALRPLSDFLGTVQAENQTAAQQQKWPDVPLEARLQCLLGWWPVSEVPPAGLALAEALRWSHFGAPMNDVQRSVHDANRDCTAYPMQPSEQSANDSAQRPAGDLASSPQISLTMPLALAEPALEMPALANGERVTALAESSAAALQRMAEVLARLNSVLPDFETYLRGERPGDYEQRGFGGHLLDVDLFTLLHNAKKLNFTGCILFSWATSLFEAAVGKGLLPDLARYGGASLYVVDGFAIDLEFKGQPERNTKERAHGNFLLLTRLCFSIQTDETRPDIKAQAIPNQAVEQRNRLLNIRENDLLAIISELDEMAAGIQKEEAAPAVASARGAASQSDDNILQLD